MVDCVLIGGGLGFLFGWLLRPRALNSGGPQTIRGS
jgi:hypothetical protein